MSPENLIITVEVLLVLFLLALCVIAVVHNFNTTLKIERNNLKLDLKQLAFEQKENKKLLEEKERVVSAQADRIADMKNDESAKNRILVALFSQLDKDVLQQMIIDLESDPHGNKTAENAVL